MRHVWIQVPQGSGPAVVQAARRHEGTNMAILTDRGSGQPQDIVSVHIGNSSLEPLLADLQSLEDPRISFAPQGVMALRPPSDHATQQVVDVTPRSPLEIFLSGLQSVGSWSGLLSYAAASGVVVWIGLLTNTIYLLVAAMLVAPFAGPAMNAAIATARGDATLLGRSLLRYVASLSVTISVAGTLSFLVKQDIATEQMIAVSQLSSAAVLLPLIAGAAGALNLVQSERNSLVSGAAVGLLIAASLAPPAGLVGMAFAMREWDLIVSGLFLLALQLVGINLGAAAVFRGYGLSPVGARYDRGRAWVARGAAAFSILALAALLTWQFWDRPNLQRSTLSERAAGTITRAVNESGIAGLIETNVRFTRADISGQHTLLAVVYAQPTHATLPEREVRRQLLDAIQRRLRENHSSVTPLIHLTLLSPPDWTDGAHQP